MTIKFHKLKHTDRNRPFIIAGPCAAESEQQVWETAEALIKNKSIDVFRAGTWKPRTNPSSFAGSGDDALSWLSQIQNHFKIPVATEIGTAKQVEAAQKFNISYLWLGARTTGNPFHVEEIINALNGCDVTIMIKNPIHPDLRAWIGAIERFINKGITQIIAIHRGFFSTENHGYRHAPIWSIPVALREHFPELPLICDPSHLSGNANHIFEVSQYALNLGMNGLMIESHRNPEAALSDSKQQITPKDLVSLLTKLSLKKDPDLLSKSKLEEWRKEIDHIDEDLMRLLFKRSELSAIIGEYKQKNNITIYSPERWGKILQNRIATARAHGLSEEYISKLFELIHEESIKIQQDIAIKKQ